LTIFAEAVARSLQQRHPGKNRACSAQVRNLAWHGFPTKQVRFKHLLGSGFIAGRDVMPEPVANQTEKQASRVLCPKCACMRRSPEELKSVMCAFANEASGLCLPEELEQSASVPQVIRFHIA
jgi:hypothetical protein